MNTHGSKAYGRNAEKKGGADIEVTQLRLLLPVLSEANKRWSGANFYSSTAHTLTHTYRAALQIPVTSNTVSS